MGIVPTSMHEIFPQWNLPNVECIASHMHNQWEFYIAVNPKSGRDVNPKSGRDVNQQINKL